MSEITHALTQPLTFPLMGDYRADLGGAGGSSIPANTLVAGAGAFLVAGDAMTPVVALNLSSDVGAFVLAGQDVALDQSNRTMAAAVGAFTLAGQSVTLTQGGGVFSPSSLTPSLSIEADTSALFQSNAGTTAATANGDVVGFVTDLSGNAFNLISTANNTSRPALQGVGSHPVIRFDGVNDILQRAAALGAYTGGAFSVSIAVKANPAVSSRLFSEAGAVQTSAQYSTHAINPTTASTSSVFIRNDAGTTQLAGSTPALTSAYGNTDVVVTITDDGSTISAYLDQGSAVTQAYTRSGSAITLDTTSLGGLMRASASSWVACDVYALVAVNGRVISSTERGNLVTYLGAKQGRTI